MAKKRRRSRYRFDSLPNAMQIAREAERVTPKRPAGVQGIFPRSVDDFSCSTPIETDAASAHGYWMDRTSRSDTFTAITGNACTSECNEIEESAGDIYSHSMMRKTVIEGTPIEMGSMVLPAEAGHSVDDDDAITATCAVACTPTRSDSDDENDMEGVLCRTKIWNWRLLWALISTNGGLKLTKLQYRSMKNFVEAVSREGYSSWKRSGKPPILASTSKKHTSCLPHYSTLQKTYRPLLLRVLVPRGIDVTAHVDVTKPGARYKSRSSTGQPLTSLQIILPSEYARSDMASAPVWSQMKSSALSNTDSIAGISTTFSNCVDTWPLVSCREWFYGQRKALSIDESACSTQSFAEEGDDVRITVIDGNVHFSEQVQRCFGSNPNSGNTTSLEGRIVHSWTVHHSRRKGDSQFEEGDPLNANMSMRDLRISELFNFVSYTSPSDGVSVHVPDLPVETAEDLAETQLQSGDIDKSASGRRKKKNISSRMEQAIKARRLALREKKAQMQAAWADWTKPIIKPGDFIVLLEPIIDREDSEDYIQCPTRSTLLTSTDRTSRLCVVSRFWVENEERARHVFFISGGADIYGSHFNQHSTHVLQHYYCSSLSAEVPPRFHLDIRSISLLSTKGGLRGMARCTPVSSVGTLLSGEPYFIYRFALYWDGFEVQKGNSASGDGFYLICLNIPLAARSSPQAVRVISLTPPGVNGQVVLDNLISDIVQGMTEGFFDFDADGVRRRVFLDLVGFMGDTPAINYFLDILGHNASSCCHLCRFVRGSETLIGSRYALGDAHGFSTHTQRGFFQHAAVRDCGAQSETCRLLGLKHNPSSASKVLHRIRDAMFDARHAVPKTSTGVAVVPYLLDPYRACFIAPDHLLTGLFRDCVTLVLKLLPSGRYTMACERFILGFLQDLGLPAQNRLFDHVKRTIFSMSITEIYALSLVAEAGFLAGCRYEDSRTGSHSNNTLSEKCEEAVGLVGCCSKLIAALCAKPNESPYDQLGTHYSAQNNGQERLQLLQTMVINYLSKVAILCKMSDTDVLTLEDNTASGQRLSMLSKQQKETLLAVKIIDKPNLHRLRELVLSTLPMVGHITHVGELVLEKTHQILKRAILQSNKKDIHLHSMRSAAFTDWAGRLTMLSQEALKGSETALLGCFRLLAGREAVLAIRARLSPELRSQVMDAFGPDGCLAHDLQSQGRSVLSTTSHRRKSGLSWRVIGQKISMDILSESNPKLWLCLTKSYCHDWNCVTVTIAGCASSSFSSIKQGSIVQMLSYRPLDLDFHCPRVVHVSAAGRIQAWEHTIGTSLWCAVHFCSLQPDGGSASMLVALLPCTKITVPTHSDGPHYARYRVCTDRPFSIAKSDSWVTVCPTLHVCTESDCTPSSVSPFISHAGNTTPLSGQPFFVVTNRDGFPPRNG